MFVEYQPWHDAFALQEQFEDGFLFSFDLDIDTPFVIDCIGWPEVDFEGILAEGEYSP